MENSVETPTKKNVNNHVCKPYNQAQECPITAFMEKFGGKWKPVIIWVLSKHGKMRFSELSRKISGISEKVLSSQLKDLLNYGIINRTITAQIPPKVDYELTEKGWSMIPVLSAILDWYVIHENN